jgi:hypothetical protein
MVSFTLWPLYPWGPPPDIQWAEGWMDPRAVLTPRQKEKFLTLTEIELRFLDH